MLLNFLRGIDELQKFVHPLEINYFHWKSYFYVKSESYVKKIKYGSRVSHALVINWHSVGLWGNNLHTDDNSRKIGNACKWVEFYLR